MSVPLTAIAIDATAHNSTSAPPMDMDASTQQRLAELEAHLELTRFVVMKVLVPIFVVFGVTGNLINIAVLTRRWMRSSTNFYLTTLAVYDVLYLTFALTLSLQHYMDVSGLRWYSYYKYHVGIPVANTCSNTGVWLTLTFTIERYIGVCHPMKGRALCTPERAKYIILVVCAAAAILTVPDFFRHRIVEEVTLGGNGGNFTVYKPKSTDVASTASFKVGHDFMTQVLFTFMPLLLLFVFNSLLIRAVMLANRQRCTMANLNTVQSERQERHSRDQHRITVMLIIVVVVFLLCQSPQAIQNTLRSYSAGISQEQNYIFKITANVFNLFVIINASANFVLYSAFSTKFRRTFSRLFCRCLQNRRSSDLMFSEGPTATCLTSVNATTFHDDSRRHLLKAGTRTGQTSYNWPRSGAQSTNKNDANNHMTNSPGSGYGHLKKKSGKQNGQNIVTCM